MAAVHGDIGNAIALNPASIALLAFAALAVVGWRLERVRVPVWGIVAVFAVLWSYQLFKYASGRPL
jgi:hypothetical protein